MHRLPEPVEPLVVAGRGFVDVGRLPKAQCARVHRHLGANVVEHNEVQGLEELDLAAIAALLVALEARHTGVVLPVRLLVEAAAEFKGAAHPHALAGLLVRRVRGYAVGADKGTVQRRPEHQRQKVVIADRQATVCRGGLGFRRLEPGRGSLARCPWSQALARVVHQHIALLHDIDAKFLECPDGLRQTGARVDLAGELGLRAVAQHQRVCACHARRQADQAACLGQADGQRTVAAEVTRVLGRAPGQGLLVDQAGAEHAGRTAHPGHRQAKRAELLGKRVVVRAVGGGGLRDQQPGLLHIPSHIHIILRWPVGVWQICKTLLQSLRASRPGGILGQAGQISPRGAVDPRELANCHPARAQAARGGRAHLGEHQDIAPLGALLDEVLNLRAIEQPLPQRLGHDQRVVVRTDASQVGQQPLALDLGPAVPLPHQLNVAVDIEPAVGQHLGALHRKAKAALPVLHDL